MEWYYISSLMRYQNFRIFLKETENFGQFLAEETQSEAREVL